MQETETTIPEILILFHQFILHVLTRCPPQKHLQTKHQIRQPNQPLLGTNDYYSKGSNRLLRNSADRLPSRQTVLLPGPQMTWEPRHLSNKVVPARPNLSIVIKSTDH